MRRNFTALLVTFLMYSFSTNAQEGRVEPNLIPPAPDAAKQIEFALTPVNQYTGKQNFSIPLHQLDFFGLPISMSLNYSSGGVKVTEEASWVGLGWSMSAGGVVSRSVRGEDDFLPNGYINDDQSVPESLPEFTTPNGITVPDYDSPYFLHLRYNRGDTEPDAYSYSFMGSSGSFILSKKSETSGQIKAIKITENADKIEYDESGEFFRVYNPQGFIGIFKLKEYTTAIGGADQASGLRGCDLDKIDILQTFADNKRAVTAWHLTEIQSPNGRVINFEYKVRSNGLSDYLSRSAHVFSERMSIDGSHQQANPLTQSCSFTVYENVYLDRIYSDDLDIEINLLTSVRSDIRPLDVYVLNFEEQRDEVDLNVLSPLKLDGFNVKSLSSEELLHQVSFGQDYFNNDQQSQTDAADFLRLRLNSVTINDQEYTFDYLDGEDEEGSPVGLPSKSSMSRDYWGYFNGQDNDHLLPVTINRPYLLSTWLHPIYPSQQWYFQTDDRKANLNYGKAGLLHQVTYPLGGYVQYEYEPHEYLLNAKETKYYNGVHTISRDGRSPALEGTTGEFNYLGSILTVGGTCSSTLVTIKLSVACDNYYNGSDCGPPLNTSSDDWAVEIRNKATNEFITGISFSELWAHNTNIYSTTIEERRLPAGDYKIVTKTKTDANGSYYGFVTVSYPESCIAGQENPIQTEDQYNQLAGGARIKRVTNYLASGKVSEKRSFTYYDDTGGEVFSSGRLVNPLFHFSQKMLWEEGGGLSDIFYVYSSGTALPGAGAAAGSHVGYGRVTEVFEGAEQGNMGKRISSFHNEENEFTEYGLGLLQNFKETNGRLKRQSTIDSKGAFLKLLDYPGPSIEETLGEIYAIKLNRSAAGLGIFSRYNIKRSFVRYPKMVVTEYLQGGSVTTETTYTYNANFLKSSETMTKSNGQEVTTLYKRAADYTSPSIVLDKMLEKNLVDQIIESVKMIDGEVVNASGTKFQVIDPEAGLPEAEKTGLPIQVLPEFQILWNEELGEYSSAVDGTSFGNEYEERLLYTQYDKYGNLTEYTNEAGVPTAIIWGYNGRYPLAQIKNAHYADVISIVDMSILNNPENELWPYTVLSGARVNELMKDALFTIMTYKPNIGLTSRTRPNGLTTHYVYDSIGRLIAIEDHEHNVIKAFTYGYSRNVTTPIEK